MCFGSIPSFGDLTQAFFGLVLEDPQKITSKELFEKALSEVQHSGVSYRFQIDDGPLYSYGPDVKIQSKTVVTKKAATSGGMHPMTPSLTHHIYSVNSNDVTTVSKEIIPQ